MIMCESTHYRAETAMSPVRFREAGFYARNRQDRYLAHLFRQQNIEKRWAQGLEAKCCEVAAAR